MNHKHSQLTLSVQRRISRDDLESVVAQGALVGNRIPRDFFIAAGAGQSDLAIHAGSYHLALKDAGIESYNHITYSSILPAIANEIERPQTYVHGSVMEGIAAVAHASNGERATAALIYGWLFDPEGKKYGGLVCEYNGNAEEAESEESLRESLQELYNNGYTDLKLYDIKFISRSLVPEKRHGTALVALCFVNYLFPAGRPDINR